VQCPESQSAFVLHSTHTPAMAGLVVSPQTVPKPMQWLPVGRSVATATSGAVQVQADTQLSMTTAGVSLTAKT